jgi:Protein of unknown function (DUF3108)
MIAAASLAALLLAAPEGCGLPPLDGGARPWGPGESLSYDLDVMGMVKAGTLSMQVDAPKFKGSVIPIRARVKNTSVFAKVRKVTGTAVTWMDAGTLRPERYRDDALWNGVRLVTESKIAPAPGDPDHIAVRWQYGDRTGSRTFQRSGEVLDLLSAVYYLRAAKLVPGDPVCFGVVGNRRLWTLEGTIAEKRERVESAAGIFDTIRIDGIARRVDDPRMTRPVHIWLEAEGRRLPVALVSEIDIGPVRAMLSRAPQKPKS